MEATIIPTPPTVPVEKRRVPAWSHRLLLACVWAYATMVVAATAALYLGGDRWWWATLLLFGPRWVFAVPLMVLLPWAALARPRLLLPLAIMVVVLAGPLTGLRLSLPPANNAVAGSTVRIVTCNTGGGIDRQSLARLIKQLDPDILALQEWPTQLELPEFFSQGWNVARQGHLVVATHYVIAEYDSLSSPKLEQWHVPAARCQLLTPHGKITFFNLHLETPRDGLEAVLHSAWRGAAQMELTTKIRETESRLAREWVQAANDPVLVAGDFNMPVESTIYRRDWSGYSNAFSKAGQGWGITKRTKWIGARIDHVLAGRQWEVVSCRVGDTLGGDHRPVIAELALRGDAR